MRVSLPLWSCEAAFGALVGATELPALAVSLNLDFSTARAQELRWFRTGRNWFAAAGARDERENSWLLWHRVYFSVTVWYASLLYICCALGWWVSGWFWCFCNLGLFGCCLLLKSAVCAFLDLVAVGCSLVFSSVWKNYSPPYIKEPFKGLKIRVGWIGDLGVGFRVVGKRT